MLIKKLTLSVLFVSFALLSASCARRVTTLQTGENNSAVDESNNHTCNGDLSVTISALTSAPYIVGQSVVYRVEAQGCSGFYRVAQSEYGFAQNIPYFFSKNYTAVGSYTESVVIQDYYFSNQMQVAQVSINVQAAPTSASNPVSCTVAANPAAPVLNASGMASVSYGISVASATTSVVQSMRYVSGGGYDTASAPSFPCPAAASHSVALQLLQAGQHVVEFTVADSSDSSRVASCTSIVSVLPAVQAGALFFLDYPTVSFNALRVGMNAAQQKTMRLSSTGGQAAMLQQIAISPASSDFSLVGGSCQSLPTLAVGSYCDIIVEYRPQASGGTQRSANLVATYNNGNSSGQTASLVLQGSILGAPNLVISPSVLQNFGSVTVGNMGTARTLSLMNNGEGVATISSLSTASSAFPLSGSCAVGTNLSAGASCTLSVNFAPYSSNSFSANLVVNYVDAYAGAGAAGFSLSVALSGQGTGAAYTQLLAQGQNSACWIRSGALSCWGRNAFGALGDGSTTTRKTPVAVSGMQSGVTSVAMGDFHACAVQSGALKCWGHNADGQLGDGTTSNRTVPVDVVGMNSGVTAVAAGGRTTCAIQSGAVKCWGNNNKGQLGDGDNRNRSAPFAISSLNSGVTMISVANDETLHRAHVCAVHNGALKCWGNNDDYQLGDGTKTDRSTPVLASGFSSGVQAVAALRYRTCVVHNSALKCWGDNGNYVLGDGSNTRRTSAIIPSGFDQGVTAVGGARDSTCAVKNGALSCWGQSIYGELGDGTRTNRKTPVAVSGMGSDVSQVAVAGFYNNCAIKGGQAYCWGENNFSQLGNGSTTLSSAPSRIP